MSTLTSMTRQAILGQFATIAGDDDKEVRLKPCSDGDRVAEIELPIDPHDGLTAAVGQALERFLIVADWEEWSRRSDALECLLSVWTELVDDAEACHEWRRIHGNHSWFVGNAEDGTLVPLTSLEVSEGEVREVPEHVMAILSTVLDEVDATKRFVALNSIEEIVRETLAVYVDDEKMYGHLVLTHSVEAGRVGTSSQERLSQHTELHQRRIAG